MDFFRTPLFDLETCCFVFVGKIIARGLGNDLCSITYLMNTWWIQGVFLLHECMRYTLHKYVHEGCMGSRIPVHRCVSLALNCNVLTLTYIVSARLSTCMEALIQLDTGCQYSHTLALVWPSAYQTFSASNAYILDQWFLGWCSSWRLYGAGSFVGSQHCGRDHVGNSNYDNGPIGKWGR